MKRRFLSLSFPFLITDWWTIRQPELKTKPVVICSPSHGRMIITSVNPVAQKENIHEGMVLADARAVTPDLHVINEQPDFRESLLERMAKWCIRFTPVCSIDAPDGLMLDVSGCSHLWGGDEAYVQTIIERLLHYGYHVKAGMADTVGTAWAVARYDNNTSIVDSGNEQSVILPMPPAALRIDSETSVLLQKLGLKRVGDFCHLPRPVIVRRFGHAIIRRLDQALGNEEEQIQPVLLPEIFSERLPCLEPISTASGILIALQRLINTLCKRLSENQKGLRKAILRCYRIDNRKVSIEVSTSKPSANSKHLLKLMEEKIGTIEPGPGIELFVLEAPIIEDHLPQQDKLWENSGALNDPRLSELIDRLSGRLGQGKICRYAPDAHYWPERAYKKVTPEEQPATCNWTEKRRPVCLLQEPEKILVTAPIPDYPPMLFRYKGKVHKITSADGPERIEQEWWIQEGEHRDYYCVEDENGCRYWLFRSGHYSTSKQTEWFLHGFFA